MANKKAMEKAEAQAWVKGKIKAESREKRKGSCVHFHHKGSEASG